MSYLAYTTLELKRYFCCYRGQ